MRFRLVCAMAMRFPSPMDSTARITSMSCQVTARFSSPPINSRMNMAKAASLGAEPIKTVTEVGAPWYTSGTHM